MIIDRVNLVLIHTANGSSYANKIARSIRWMNANRNTAITPIVISVNDIQKLVDMDLDPQGTLIHSRAAHPSAKWMMTLAHLEKAGFDVLNSTAALTLTSNKLRCSELMFMRGMGPATWELSKVVPVIMPPPQRNPYEKVVIKPVVSSGMGKHVKLALWKELYADPLGVARDVPGDRVVVQEFVDFKELYRVICFGGAGTLPFMFADNLAWHEYDNDWKVSVCLNKNQRVMALQEDVREFALLAQDLVGGDINFVDVYRLRNGGLQISEINTACNLSIHERLAERAGFKHFNIHYQIARHLVDKLYMEE